ncbi:DnaA regulatory inactivator Hda [Gammaproteobacteria bacterium]|nr:DnaA regulatory inactivator Hda [Gammaproteobacteria bacterium]|tara:strand:+ start:1236 stop:1922 length:687 start_codon:yes stop_codon:yes gene_type:complete
MSNPKQLTFPWNKDNKSSFDSFYASKLNKHLLSLLQNNTFKDDLLIFGTKDSGKTYLLQALCNHFSNQGKSSFYLPMKQAKELSVDILESLESMELVCIDGIESIVGNKVWEIGLFNLINRSLNSKNRLIFTSSKNIDVMNFELTDLDSRLRKIQSHELYALADDEILSALKHIANLRSIELGSKEAQYLLTYANRNISDLVQILESLDQLSMEMKRKITIPLIKEVI